MFGYHIIAGRDSSNNTFIYINGVLSLSGSSSKTLNISQASLRIGSRSDAATSDEFGGKIRDVRMYDYALSVDQAASLYSGSYNVTPEHWYKT